MIFPNISSGAACQGYSPGEEPDDDCGPPAATISAVATLEDYFQAWGRVERALDSLERWGGDRSRSADYHESGEDDHVRIVAMTLRLDAVRELLEGILADAKKPL